MFFVGEPVSTSPEHALTDEASFLSKEIKRGQQRQAEDREMIGLDTFE